MNHIFNNKIQSYFIINYLAAFLLLINLISCTNPNNVTKKEKQTPNILFFLVDDQRNDALGCYGHPIIQTPNIDGLAQNGVKFTNAFVTTSICMASRASIMSGMHSRTMGVNAYITPIQSAWVKYVYPLQMRNNGITTGFIGKFGFRVNGDVQPEDWFDYFKPLGRNPYLKEMEDGSLRHETELAGDYAIEFLQMQNKVEPFCLSVSFNSVHAEDNDRRPGIGHFPWPKAVDGMYEDQIIPEPKLSDPMIFEQMPDFLKTSFNRERYYWRWDTQEKYQTNMKAYFRMISGVDHVIGRVMKELKDLGLSDNTIIIYSADNGYYMGDRGFAGKWSHFEESLRVPMIIYDPRLPEEKRGKIIEKLSLNIDLTSTFLDYMNIKIPVEYEGRSLIPLINETENIYWRKEFFCEHLNNHPKIPKWEGIRTENYIYARYFENNFEFFHDLNTDPFELRNFISVPSHTNKIEELREKCEQEIKTYEMKAKKYTSSN